MGRVVFALTDRQAEALLSIRKGQLPGRAGRFRTRILSTLRKRGLVDGGALCLTPQGEAAALLIDKLAIADRLGGGGSRSPAAAPDPAGAGFTAAQPGVTP